MLNFGCSGFKVLGSRFQVQRLMLAYSAEYKPLLFWELFSFYNRVVKLFKLTSYLWKGIVAGNQLKGLI